jgi:arsenite methyltransferase
MKDRTRQAANAKDRRRAAVRERYEVAARRLGEGQPGGCCGDRDDELAKYGGKGLYTADELRDLPQAVSSASLGSGNPVAMASLQPGETVLDLGSGAGLDVIIAARRVGAEGVVYGLDMTDEMLEVSRANQRAAHVTNATFLKGDIESIPLPNGSVDVVISNCVINLSVDKQRVIAEVFRVLKPGGRFVVSDIVALRPVPNDVRQNPDLWAGCVAGSVEIADYERMLRDSGFDRIRVEPTGQTAQGGGCACGSSRGVVAEDKETVLDGLVSPASVWAIKPRS